MFARKMIIGMAMLVLLMMRGPTFGSTIRVDCESTHPNPDGSTWGKAYKYLRDALDAGSSGDDIWVAEGTYYPDQNSTYPSGTDDRSDTFAIGTNVSLYGGFPPGGDNGQHNWDMNDRDPKAYETILSGDINEPDDVNDNSYHVVTGADDVVIDGFTISGGKAQDQAFCGAGIFSYCGWPPSTITLKNCVIRDNKAGRYGAGMYNEYFAATIENCFFVDNTSGSGCGILSQGAAPTLTNCVFSGNQTTVQGSKAMGGAIRVLSSSVTLTNCTFSNNIAGNAGGVCVDDNAVVKNCIFWGNTDSGGSDESAQLQVGGTATVTYSCIQGLDEFSGSGNIGDDPLFRDESRTNGIDGIFGTLDDGLIMWGDSPCIDTGDNNAVPGGISEDITDFPRIADGDKDTDRIAVVDMGAYEFQRSYLLRIAGGEDHTLLLQADGTVWGCGVNGNGQIGDGTTEGPRYEIVQTLGLEHSVGIDAGWYHSLAADIDCNVWAWGKNTHGQIGDDDSAQNDVETIPVEVNDTSGSNPLTDIHGISAGRSGEYSLAFDGSGSAWGWGANDKGQLGDNNYGTDRYTPAQVVGEGGTGYLENIIDIDAGADHSIALDDSGDVWCWGDNLSGQLGYCDSSSYEDTPVQVMLSCGANPTALENIVDVAAGSYYSGSSYALDANGSVWAWGEGSDGRLGQGSGDTSDHSHPVKVLGGAMGGTFLENIVAISAGEGHVLALDEDANVWAWGLNNYKQLGDGTNNYNSCTPVQVKKINAGYGYLTDIVYIDAGYRHSMAIDIDNNVWVWGKNGNGELGLGPYLLVNQKYAQIMASEDPPANDDCEDATTAVLNQAYFGTTALATDANVWYEFTAPNSTTVNFSLCGSNYDTNLKLWDACDGTKLAENEDATTGPCSGTYQSYLSYSVTADTTYYIAVSGYSGETGNYILKITE